MTDIPVLIVNGQLKGQIRRMPIAGLINVEPVDPDFVPTVMDLTGEYQQVHYRPGRIELMGERVWIGWCNPDTQPPVTDLVETLLSDLAKQLIDITRNADAGGEHD